MEKDLDHLLKNKMTCGNTPIKNVWNYSDRYLKPTLYTVIIENSLR